jgi:hypothetical protein
MMKICVLEFEDAQAGLLADERFVNLRRLADIGLYGELPPLAAAAGDNASGAPPSVRSVLWEPVSAASSRPILMEVFTVPDQTSANPWHCLTNQVTNPDWDYIHLVDRGLAHFPTPSDNAALTDEYCLRLDQRLGTVMDMLDEHTILLVTAYPRQGSEGTALFLLASPNCPLLGECQGAQWADLAPTLLDLAGRTIPTSAPGRSLVAGLEKRAIPSENADHQKALLERLAGLGYV